MMRKTKTMTRTLRRSRRTNKRTTYQKKDVKEIVLYYEFKCDDYL